ncbi:MAG: hypothetical protein ACJ714_01975 [Ornithinibacter sp.]
MSDTPTGPTPPQNRGKAAPSGPGPMAQEGTAQSGTSAELPSHDAVDAAEPVPTQEMPATVAPASGALTSDERAELVRLRAQVAATQALPQSVVVTAPDPARRHRGRWAGAMVFLLVAALLAPLAALASWSRSTLLDQDRYLAMVAPLAKDPAVQKEVSLRITNAVFEQLKVKQLTTQTLDAIAARPRVAGVTENLPVELSTFSEPISNAIYGFTEDQVSKLVASSAFQDAWVAANREAHAGVVAALTGQTGTNGVVVSNGQVAVNLGPFIQQIKPILIERGVPFADKIPVVDARFVVLQSEALARAQSAVRLLDLLRVVLPVLALLALVAGVALAPGRRRALVIGSSMIVGTLVLLLLGVQVGRALYLDDLEKALLVPQVATVLFDGVTTPLRVWVRASAMLFLLIALAAWVAGPSSAATAVRSVPARLSGMTGTPTGALGSVSRFAAHNTVVLRAVVGGLAVLALLVGDRPSAGTVLLIAVLAAVALVVVEVLRRWGAEGAGEMRDDAVVPDDAVAAPGAPA